jgi:GDP-mannose transporter
MNNKNADSVFKRIGTPVLSLLLYSCSSVSMMLLNKLLVDTYKSKFNFLALFAQNALAVLAVSFAKYMNWISYPDFSLEIVKVWIPITSFFTLMISTSLWSLAHVSVPLFNVLKNCAIILTAYGENYFFGRKLDIKILSSFVLMIAGSIVTSLDKEIYLTFFGAIYVLANILATVCYVLYLKYLLKKHSLDMGHYGVVFYNNILSLPILALFVGYYGEIDKFLNS